MKTYGLLKAGDLNEREKEEDAEGQDSLLNSLFSRRDLS